MLPHGDMAQQTNGPSSINEAITEFTLQLYRKISNTDAEQNMFLSPYSVSAALMLTMLGCSGQSESQLRHGLCIHGIVADNVHDVYKQLHNFLMQSSIGTTTLSIANRIFTKKDLRVHDNYRLECLQYYGSELEQLDFAGNTEGSRLRINDWIAKETNNKIMDLIPQGALTSEAVVVLTNAIYFKGKWSKQFSATDTKKQAFHPTMTKSVEVDMMSIKRKRWVMGSSQIWQCKVLQLPYEGERLSMMVVLPDNVDGLRNIEMNLSMGLLGEITSSMCEDEIAVVAMPKFKMETSFELGMFIAQLGIVDIFSPAKADFSRMLIDPQENASVSNIIHKAFVEVNEEGTEAAAATAVFAFGGCAFPAPKTFIADHPFLFFIMENYSKTILFIGRFTQPPI